MSQRPITVATMTLARTREDERVLTEALPRLTAHGWPAVVADGGSTDSFRQFLRGRKDLRLVQSDTPGLVGQIRTALHSAAADGSSFVLYTEPDKATFFEEHLADFVRSAPFDDGVGVVLAARSASAFETYPSTQRSAEAAINTLCRDLIGREGDYSYGPFLLSRRLVPFISQLGHEIGWGWRHFLFGTAARLRLKVLHVEGNFECPPGQRDEDDAERLHRMRQLQQNVNGLLLSRT